MPRAGWRESDYQNFLLVPVYLTIIVTYLLTIALTIVRLLFWTRKWSVLKRVKRADQKMIAYILEGFFNMLLHRENIQGLSDTLKGREPPPQNHAIAGAAVLQEEEPARREETTTAKKLEAGYSRLFSGNYHSVEEAISEESGLRVLLQADTILSSKWAMTILSWYVATVSSLGITVFWIVFTVREYSECVEDLDCYTTNIGGGQAAALHNGTPLSAMNITCSMLNAGALPNVRVTCYDIILDFPKAIAELTGILFIGANGFSFLMFVILLVVDGVPSGRCRRVVVLAFIAAAEYACVGFIIFAFVARVELLGKEHSLEMLLQEVMVSAALLAGATTPWALLLWAYSKWKGRVRKARDHAISEMYILCEH